MKNDQYHKIYISRHLWPFSHFIFYYLNFFQIIWASPQSAHMPTDSSSGGRRTAPAWPCHCQQQNIKKPSQNNSHGKECKKTLTCFSYRSLLQDAESKSETSQAISAREHFVFTDTDGQVYHITVEGNTVKDGARIPPDVSPETMCPFFYVSFFASYLPELL